MVIITQPHQPFFLWLYCNPSVCSCVVFFSCALGVIKASTISLVHLNRFRLLAYTMPRVAQLSQEVLVIVLNCEPRQPCTTPFLSFFLHHPIHCFILPPDIALIVPNFDWPSFLLNFPTLFLANLHQYYISFFSVEGYSKTWVLQDWFKFLVYG